MFHRSLFLLASFVSVQVAFATVYWNQTDFMFVFGDSYSSDGYDITAGIDSPNPKNTTSNGPNWVEFLSCVYNQTDIKTFNLASHDATIDSAIVPPCDPAALSIVDQVSQFNQYLASKPPGAEWDGSNSLFAFWAGINDVVNTISWTNYSEPTFFCSIIDRFFCEVESLYDAGARNFLFLLVPPLGRAPLFSEQGPSVVARVHGHITEFNYQLTQKAKEFEANHTDLVEGGGVTVIDTEPILNTILDVWAPLGFVNITGYCPEYALGGTSNGYQAPGCAPMSSYFWMNPIYPLYTVHDMLAKTISTCLACYCVI